MASSLHNNYIFALYEKSYSDRSQVAIENMKNLGQEDNEFCLISQADNFNMIVRTCRSQQKILRE